MQAASLLQQLATCSLQPCRHMRIVPRLSTIEGFEVFGSTLHAWVLQLQVPDYRCPIICGERVVAMLPHTGHTDVAPNTRHLL